MIVNIPQLQKYVKFRDFRDAISKIADVCKGKIIEIEKTKESDIILHTFVNNTDKELTKILLCIDPLPCMAFYRVILLPSGIWSIDKVDSQRFEWYDKLNGTFIPVEVCFDYICGVKK